MKNIWSRIADFGSLVTFSHTVFAMPFAFIGFFTAVSQGYPFQASLFLKVVLCMVFARSAAMAFNRYADREIDAKNPRTMQREIPGGIISPRASLFFVIINSILFVITTLSLNMLCFWLSPVALAVVLGYSYAKRFTSMCHLILGVGLALAPIGAYVAVTASFAWLPLFYSFAVVCWVSGFDIIYALQDDEFDKGLGLHSIPAYFGRKGALSTSRLLHLMSFMFILVAGYSAGYGVWYYIGSLFFLCLLIYQHRLVSPDDLSRVNRAFFTTNGIASVVFFVFVILEMFL